MINAFPAIRDLLAAIFIEEINAGKNDLVVKKA
jgi:hypothetical protein